VASTLRRLPEARLPFVLVFGTEDPSTDTVFLSDCEDVKRLFYTLYICRIKYEIVRGKIVHDATEDPVIKRV
jgi:hypothetical protein